ncbi:MAG: hypothetical protein HC782_00145 [Gammaproteobacteria bacterium]|nr:hypothetical protein [Gammaproteobacteria bacterium]
MQVIDVAPTAGALWIRDAWRLFRQQPLQWLSVTSSWVLISLFMMAIPSIGAPAATMAQPGFFAGFVLACRDQEMGKPVMFTHLFAGFKVSGRSLIQIGGVSLLAELLVLLALNAVGFFDGLAGKEIVDLTPESLAAAFDGKEVEWFAALAAIIAIKGVLWFSAALMAHQPMPASHAIRWSFFALIGNVMPLLFFACIMFTLLVIATLPWLLGLLIFLPIYAISHYTSFKAVFMQNEPPA